MHYWQLSLLDQQEKEALESGCDAYSALVRDVVRRIEDLARATGARRVTGAKIWLGALSHLSEEHFREHFAIEAQRTRVDGAALAIEVSQNPDHPHAQHIRLESVDLDE